MDTLLLRYGELFLKGRNRPSFERQLRQNIERMTGKKVHSTRGRLLLEYFPEHRQLQRVFGLISYSPAWRVEKDIEKIKEKTLEAATSFSGTFKIETKRSDKTFPLTSFQVNAAVGQYIEQNTALSADYKNPRHTLHLEINQEAVYLFTEIVPGPGGLPVGSSGTVQLLVENEASILAGLLMMKRGCSLLPISKKSKDLSLLQQFSSRPLPVSGQVLPGNVLVTGETFPRKKQHAEFTLHPLIAYTASQIRRELATFSFLSTSNSSPRLPVPNLL